MPLFCIISTMISRSSSVRGKGAQSTIDLRHFFETTSLQISQGEECERRSCTSFRTTFALLTKVNGHVNVRQLNHAGVVVFQSLFINAFPPSNPTLNIIIIIFGKIFTTTSIVIITSLVIRRWYQFFGCHIQCFVERTCQFHFRTRFLIVPTTITITITIVANNISTSVIISTRQIRGSHCSRYHNANPNVIHMSSSWIFLCERLTA
mmetsp:Transcript_9435/g.17024  ORF Transcript_9435/g.17024 Transcript_9435/m.17024 type:complete len:207 (+) Transcript_9435:385-1005(+)